MKNLSLKFLACLGICAFLTMPVFAQTRSAPENQPASRIIGTPTPAPFVLPTVTPRPVATPTPSADSIVDRILRGDPSRAPQPTPTPAQRRGPITPEELLRPDPELVQREAQIASTLPASFALNMSDLEEYLTGFFPTRPLNLHLVFPRTGQISLKNITRGSAVAQAVALRTMDRPVYVSTSNGVRRRHFNVLIGTREELRNELHPEFLGRIRGSFLGLQPMRDEDENFALVISGVTDEQVDEAILSIGLVQRNLPEAPFLSIQNVLLPDRPVFFRQPPLQPRQIVSFEDLQNLDARIFQLAGGGLMVGINLAPDTFNRPAGNIRIRLHFSIGQQTIRTSRNLEVLIDERSVQVIPWTASTETDLGTRTIMLSIPYSEFRPGQNFLTLRPYQAVASEFALGTRSEIDSDFTVFNDSLVEIPNVARFARLPDLNLVGRTFFPFIGQPDGSELSVILLDRDLVTVETAWTFMAKVSQISNSFMYAAEFNFTPENNNRHVVAIGSYSSLPENYRSRLSNQAFSEVGRNVLDLSNRVEDDLPWHKRWWERIRSEVVVIRDGQSRSLREDRRSFEIIEESIILERGPRAVMTSFPRETNLTKWVLVVTARSPELLQERVRLVVQNEFWNRIEGVTFSWINSPSSITAVQPEARFIELSFTEIVALPTGYFGVSLRVFYIFFAVIFILFIFVTIIVLNKAQKVIMDR
jgi:hypothetical protein